MVGTYVGAHDKLGSSKTLGCAVAADGQTVRFSISATPPGAGLPLQSLPRQQMTVDFPIVVAALDDSGLEDDWFAAAEIYRGFVIPHASWTQQGPLSKRDDVPLWAQELTVWVNSHWQPNDIFNVSGGAPSVVENRVARIEERFGLGKGRLGLHWYEWDTLGYAPGSNYSICSSEITCGFDTHYPEYFPVRENFQASLKRIQQESGVRVAPYINGRIFDQATHSWSRNNGTARRRRADLSPLLGNVTDLHLYNGFDKAEFAVMCPHTAYWQETLADVVGSLRTRRDRWGLHRSDRSRRPAAVLGRLQSLSGGASLAQWVPPCWKSAASWERKALADRVKCRALHVWNRHVSGARGVFWGTFLTDPVPVTKRRTLSRLSRCTAGIIWAWAHCSSKAISPRIRRLCSKIANQFLFGAQMGWFSLGGQT